MELELDPLFGEEARNIWLDENKDDLGGFYEEENSDDEQINHDYQAQLMKAIENVFAKGVEYYVWRIEDGACGACEDMEGEIFEFRGPLKLSMALHNNCRCTLELLDKPEIKAQVLEWMELLRQYQPEGGTISLESIYELLNMAGLEVVAGELAEVMKSVSSAYEKAKNYLGRSLKQVVLGNYTDDVTALGTAGQIALGLTGLDAASDIRDLTHDLTNWQWTWGHAGKTLLDGVGLLPVVGALKNADEVAALLKNSDEMLQSAGSKWFNADGTPKWPDNDGFTGNPVNTTLQPGTKIDRVGDTKGTFAAPEGTPYSQRSLPPGSESSPLNSYEVLKPLEVNSGTTAPWFDQPGGGAQYQLPMSVDDLLRQGYIRETTK